MTTNYTEYHQHLEERLMQLGRELPGPMSGFARLHKRAIEDGALSQKTKELMAVAISIVISCEGCIAYHVHDAIAQGATRQELLETYAAYTIDAMEQFLPETNPNSPD
jgi:AhpD family alkylhydroperoxidase